ncbi:MAG: hypothetical protein CVV27_04935 [Candidatus Melainabacteria bacterium HGW-Melainabacteria-1]|nr:MAG: hypothetical protein CVV27_04935 [Candidatus Melainabacteria bacterium HGW-Melainabacteria-1]
MKLLIWGAGSLGLMLLDTIERIDPNAELAWLADNLPRGTVHQGLTVFGDRHALKRAAAEGWQLALALGQAGHRHQALGLARAANIPLLSLIDPVALVSSRAQIAPGCLVMPSAIVNAGAVLDEGVLVHNQALISHHVRLGEAVSVFPGARLLGGSQVGIGVSIGAGALVLPGMAIGEWATIAPATVVMEDIEARTLVAGNPARTVQRLADIDVPRLFPMAEPECMDLRLQNCLRAVWGRIPSPELPWELGLTPEWDSLAHLRLVAEVEARFSLRLSQAEILSLKDLPSLKAILTQHGVTL